MTTRLDITTNNPLNGALAFCLPVLLLIVSVSAPAWAHGGYNHVKGTVVKVANGVVLTVNTGKANIDVKLDSHTDLTKNGQKAEIADLKPGARVIVDLPELGKDKPAHSVKIGAMVKTPGAHTHDTRK